MAEDQTTHANKRLQLLLNKLEEQSSFIVDLHKSVAEIANRVAQVEITQNQSFQARLDALANLSTPTGVLHKAPILHPPKEPATELNSGKNTQTDLPSLKNNNRIIDLTHTLSPHVLFQPNNGSEAPNIPFGEKLTSTRYAFEPFDVGTKALGPIQENLLSPLGQSTIAGPPQRIKVQPREFDGKTAWHSYRLHFESVARVNGWMNEHKALYLAPYLRGTALAFFETLPPDVCDDFIRLDLAMKQRFGNEYEQSTAHCELRGRIQRPKESLNELATDIQRLTYLAFPDCPEHAKQRISLAQFVDAIYDLELQQRVRDAAPDTLEKALSIAIRAEASRVASRLTRKQIRVSEAFISKDKIESFDSSSENESRAA